MSTIRDVAELAKVSIGSVSNYLNGGKLKTTTSGRIQEAMDTLDYHQNIIAKGLKNNRSMSIGVLINSLSDVFAISIVSEIEGYVESFGYSIIICDYKGDNQRFEEKLNFLYNRSIDAVVVFHQDEGTPMLHKLSDEHIPIIAIDAPINGIDSDVILVDNYETSKKAVTQLMQTGYQNIGIIAGNHKNYIARERERGYHDALQGKNVQIKKQYIWQGDYTIESGFKGTNQLLDNNPQMTAIFVINYYMALGAIKALRQRGLQAGENIGMVVFDHFLMNDIFYPEITSIKQPIGKMGRAAGELLINRLIGSDKEKSFQKIYCATKIIASSTNS